MVDISIVNGIINQVLTGGAPPNVGNLLVAHLCCLWSTSVSGVCFGGWHDRRYRRNSRSCWHLGLSENVGYIPNEIAI